MFTGIIESLGEVVELQKEQGNMIIDIRSSISSELKIDQSLAHNGVCLTVVQVSQDIHRVIAIDETLRKTNLGDWKKGSIVNLERCLMMNGRIDGHMVQGHVDETGVCRSVQEAGGSWVFEIEYNSGSSNITIEKGSIALNGISLTVFNSGKNSFSVAIIPYTFEHTNMQYLKPGDRVNLEFDMIGKYVAKMVRQ